MGRKASPVDEKVQKAVELKQKAPVLTIPQAMMAAEFTSDEARNPSIQMKVRRHLEKTPPAPPDPSTPIPKVVQANDSPLSPLTNNTPDGMSHASRSTKSSSKSSISETQALRLAGGKTIRKTSSQAQQERINKKKMQEVESRALKEATKMFADQRNKSKKERISAANICASINTKFGTKLTARTVQRYVQEGSVGESPKKAGCNGKIPPEVYEMLVGAFASYVRITQANSDDGTKNTRKHLSQLVNGVINVVEKGNRTSDKLLNRLLRDSGINLNASVSVSVEERRIRWTTYENLRLWFETWKRELKELGFLSYIEGKPVIPDDQLARILNLDESCLSLDGSQGRRGGRPTATFFDPNLPRVGKAAAKSSLTTTFITGSTAAGEALPPHFQFSTKAVTTERERIKRETFLHFHSVRGKFGNDVKKAWPTTVGLNSKGGMDDAEFEKYLMNSIVPLYPDARDWPGKRVIIKIDSGPGRMNNDLLARLRNLGFMLYPGVPNTTSVMSTDTSLELSPGSVR